MFPDIPDGFTVYREFDALRVTVAQDGKCVGIQFAEGKAKPEYVNILQEEGYWPFGIQWVRQDAKNPRRNLAETIRLARELDAYLHNRNWPPRGRGS